MARYWPLGTGRIVTSPFGPRGGGFHAGTDFGFPGGSANKPVYACASGTVIYAGAAQGYGGPDPAGWLVIDHPARAGGGCTEYGHIIREVARGAHVTAGQRIARINPDSATNGGVAPHLHLSVMPREYNPKAKMDPIPWLAGALEPPAAATIFGPDISNNNGVVDLDRVKAEGFEFVWAKVSEGTSFRDTYWPRTRDWAREIGLILAGYHYIRVSDPNRQADLFVDQLGDRSIPAMLDFEEGSGGIDNFWAVLHAIEARGVHVALSYIPRWYWERIGRPDLSRVPGLIQSSYVNGTGYASVLYPGDDSIRWAPFGGRQPDVLQFTDRALIAGKRLDANAFRGSPDQLRTLTHTGRRRRRNGRMEPGTCEPRDGAAGEHRGRLPRIQESAAPSWRRSGEHLRRIRLDSPGMRRFDACSVRQADGRRRPHPVDRTAHGSRLRARRARLPRPPGGRQAGAGAAGRSVENQAGRRDEGYRRVAGSRSGTTEQLMMSTAEEVKAEMFGDNPPAGHHDGGGPLLAKLERHPLPLARLDYTRVDDAGQITSQIAAPTPGARPVGHGRAIRFPGAHPLTATEPFRSWFGQRAGGGEITEFPQDPGEGVQGGADGGMLGPVRGFGDGQGAFR